MGAKIDPEFGNWLPCPGRGLGPLALRHSLSAALLLSFGITQNASVLFCRFSIAHPFVSVKLLIEILYQYFFEAAGRGAALTLYKGRREGLHMTSDVCRTCSSAAKTPSFLTEKRGFCGACGRTRTGDLRITNALLYQLSHASGYSFIAADTQIVSLDSIPWFSASVNLFLNFSLTFCGDPI